MDAAYTQKPRTCSQNCSSWIGANVSMLGMPCSTPTSKPTRFLLVLRIYHASKSHTSSTAESTTRNVLPCPLPPQVEPLAWVPMRPGALVVAATTVLRMVILVTTVEVHPATKEFLLRQHDLTTRVRLHMIPRR
jgi:hypothetical protein